MMKRGHLPLLPKIQTSPEASIYLLDQQAHTHLSPEELNGDETLDQETISTKLQFRKHIIGIIVSNVSYNLSWIKIK